MRAFVLHATKNTGTKVDATGAFIPEALAFAKYAQKRGAAVEYRGFDNALGEDKRRAQVEDLLHKAESFDIFAFFGHGWRTGLQSGHALATVKDLANAIHTKANTELRVVLYACSTGGDIATAGPAGEGGFADALRDALVTHGHTGWLDAHTTAGHTTRNPNLRRFVFEHDLIGGERFFDAGSLTWRRWADYLRADGRFALPFESIDEIRAHVRV